MINTIELINFRRYKQVKLNVSSKIVIFVGDNAVGKTTILESIYLISTTKSPRTKNFNNLITYQKDYAKVNLSSDKNYSVFITPSGKTCKINNKVFKKISEYIGNLKTVYFSPQDLSIIYGTSSIRRNFFDLYIAQINKKYLFVLTETKKILKERNNLLKHNHIDEVYLKTVTSLLIEKMKYIITIRKKFIKLLNKYFIQITSSMSLLHAEIEYKPNLDLANIDELFNKQIETDKKYKYTTLGIHHDEYVFTINKKEAVSYASQGQVRSLVVGLIISLQQIISNVSKQETILLLDDVFSELDENKQESLVKFLQKLDQTFITTTNISSVPEEIKEKAIIYKIEASNIKELTVCKGDKNNGKYK